MPFDNAQLRRAIALTIDRQAYVDIIANGQGAIGGAMRPPPEGIWGMPPYVMRNLPATIRTSRRAARRPADHGDAGLRSEQPAKGHACDAQHPRVPRSAVILISQLKEIYIDADLNPIDTAQWYPTLMRKDFKIAMNVTETAVDDPDVIFYENYTCGSQRNYRAYCNQEVDKLIDRQSVECNVEKRKRSSGKSRRS